MHITLLKLGGSLITDKSQPYTTQPEMITQVIGEIQKAQKDNPDLSLILGNGAGSFAHQSAKKYGTRDGFTDENGRFGACVVHQDAIKLNSILLEECIAQHLPVFSMQPSTMLVSQDKAVSSQWFIPLDALLHTNIIPFVYGDVIIDQHIGSTIFSTDTLFRLIAEYLSDQGHAITIIHAGNYDGVLDRNGKVIAEITPDTVAHISEHLLDTAHIDVTGGMRLKVEEQLTLTQRGIVSFILNGTVRGNVEAALQGAHIGTRIMP